ncbi:hypothetical protein QEM13_002692 [Pseudomonas putida]|nr:hypothetical protein [Pseudomonas putida]
MSKRNCYDCIRAVVREKTTTSHTRGAVTATGTGRNISVSNNIATDIKQDVLLEFPDGKIVKTVLINESIDAPVGHAIFIAFLKGEPIAYRLSGDDQIHSLGYTSQKSSMTGKEFMLLLAPVAGTLFGFAFASTPDKYYENGQMREHHAGQAVAGVGLAVTALSIWLMRSWIPYFVGTAVSGVATAITAIVHYSRENQGRKQLLSDLKKEFDTLEMQG